MTTEISFMDWLQEQESVLEDNHSPFQGGFDEIRYRLSLVHQTLGIKGIRFKDNNQFLIEYGEILRTQSPSSSRSRDPQDELFRQELAKQASIKKEKRES